MGESLTKCFWCIWILPQDNYPRFTSNGSQWIKYRYTRYWNGLVKVCPVEMLWRDLEKALYAVKPSNVAEYKSSEEWPTHQEYFKRSPTTIHEVTEELSKPLQASRTLFEVRVCDSSIWKSKSWQKVPPRESSEVKTSADPRSTSRLISHLPKNPLNDL